MADVSEGVCLVDFVDVDDSAVVCGALTDQKSISQIRNAGLSLVA